MRNMFIAFTIIILIISFSMFLSGGVEDMSPEEVTLMYIEKLLTATPDTQSEIFDINMFSEVDIISYIEMNYSDIATERMMKNMLMNRYITISSDIAFDFNSNITVENLKITATQYIDEKVYFNFDGITKTISIETGETLIYPFSGQVGLKIIDEISKVDTLRFFTVKLLDHGSKDIE